MFKKFFCFSLFIVITCLLTNNIYSQMQNKWDFVDTLEVKKIKIGNETLNIYFGIGANYQAINKKSCYDKNNIVVLASWSVEQPQYIIRKTTDGGTTWNTIYRDTTEYVNNNFKIILKNIYHPSSKKIILIGYNRPAPYQYFLKYSNDLCKTWNTIEFDTSIYISALNMLDSLFGVIAFQNSGVDSLMITNDGLKTFTLIGLPDSLININQIVCISKNKFFIISDNYSKKISYLYNTEDGGKSWSLIKTPQKEYLYQMKFLNQDVGFIEYNNDLYKTEDGGKTWIDIGIHDNYNKKYIYHDFDFSDENKGVVIDGAYGVYITNNSGKNWLKEDTPFTTGNSSNAIVIYPPNGTPLIGYDDYFICKRTEKKIFKSPLINLIDYNQRFVLPKGNKISWENIKGADSYELLIKQYNYGNTNLVQLADTVLNDTTILLNFNYQSMYYFRIRAFNNSLSSEFSGPQYAIYTVGDSNEIPSPKILYPRYPGMYPLKFTAYWSSEIGIDTFDIELFESNPFHEENKILEVSNYADTSLILKNLSSDSSYYFHVRNKKNNKVSRWAAKSFYASSLISVEDKGKYLIKNNAEISLKIIPNPSYNLCKAIIISNKNINKIESIKLFDFLGDEIKNINFRISNSNKEKQIDFDVSSLPDGIYFLMINYMQSSSIGKFVIKR